MSQGKWTEKSERKGLTDVSLTVTYCKRHIKRYEIRYECSNGKVHRAAAAAAAVDDNDGDIVSRQNVKWDINSSHFSGVGAAYAFAMTGAGADHPELPDRGGARIGVDLTGILGGRMAGLTTPCFKKTSTHIIGYKLRKSCPILIIFDIKIPHII